MKDRAYHESAIKYNEEFAKLGERLARTLEDPEVAGWCKGIGKQHRFHAKKHKTSLDRLEREEQDDALPQDERQHELADSIITELELSSSQKFDTTDIIKHQADFAAEKENVA